MRLKVRAKEQEAEAVTRELQGLKEGVLEAMQANFNEVIVEMNQAKDQVSEAERAKLVMRAQIDR